jgi:hypothetical protein
VAVLAAVTTPAVVTRSAINARRRTTDRRLAEKPLLVEIGVVD